MKRIRLSFIEVNASVDRDEDGSPCIENDTPEIEAIEIETPHDPICPVLYQWLERAETVHQVLEFMTAHENSSCPVCASSKGQAYMGGVQNPLVPSGTDLSSGLCNRAEKRPAPSGKMRRAA